MTSPTFLEILARLEDHARGAREASEALAIYQDDWGTVGDRLFCDDRCITSGANPENHPCNCGAVAADAALSRLKAREALKYSEIWATVDHEADLQRRLDIAYGVQKDLSDSLTVALNRADDAEAARLSETRRLRAALERAHTAYEDREEALAAARRELRRLQGPLGGH